MKLEQELFFDCQLYIHTDQITKQYTIPAPLFHSKTWGGGRSTLLLSLHKKGIKLFPGNSNTTVVLPPELKMRAALTIVKDKAIESDHICTSTLNGSHRDANKHQPTSYNRTQIDF